MPVMLNLFDLGRKYEYNEFVELEKVFEEIRKIS